MQDEELRKVVSEKYAKAAAAARSGRKAACCEPSCCGGSDSGSVDPITRDLYNEAEKSDLPAEAVAASLGCGNPTALAQIRQGEVVLDLGSGGGMDVLLSAKRVGPAGKAYGLDMTDDMIALARENLKKSGLANVEFLKGQIEEIPLPESSVDVIISNCVINLSADKDRVLREAFRVVRPGGRLAVSDVVVLGPVPPDLRKSVELWIGCLAGALEESDYRSKLRAAGFEEIGIEVTRVYSILDAREMLTPSGIDVDRIAPEVDGKFASAFIRARKPA